MSRGETGLFESVITRRASALLLLAAIVIIPMLNPIGFVGGGGDDNHYLDAARCWVAAGGVCVPPSHWWTRWPTIAPMAASFYAELIWNSRTQRAKTTGKGVDWVVLRNRLQHIESHNLRRVGAALDELARRVGFRVIPGLGERVIYRELFPKGLTLLDLQQLGEVGIAHITARQELREMIAGLGIPDPGAIEPIAAAG